jgi:hypothetical protein
MKTTHLLMNVDHCSVVLGGDTRPEAESITRAFLRDFSDSWRIPSTLGNNTSSTIAFAELRLESDADEEASPAVSDKGSSSISAQLALARAGCPGPSNRCTSEADYRGCRRCMIAMRGLPAMSASTSREPKLTSRLEK